MSAATETATGTRDKAHHLLWFTEACLSNVARLEGFIHDAEQDGDEELVEFFRRAKADSLKGAQQGKALLTSRLVG